MEIKATFTWVTGKIWRLPHPTWILFFLLPLCIAGWYPNPIQPPCIPQLTVAAIPSALVGSGKKQAVRMTVARPLLSEFLECGPLNLPQLSLLGDFVHHLVPFWFLPAFFFASPPWYISFTGQLNPQPISFQYRNHPSLVLSYVPSIIPVSGRSTGHQQQPAAGLVT